MAYHIFGFVVYSKKELVKDVLVNEGQIKAMTKFRELYKGCSLVDAKRFIDKLKDEISA